MRKSGVFSAVSGERRAASGERRAASGERTARAAPVAGSLLAASARRNEHRLQDTSDEFDSIRGLRRLEPDVVG
jgi:hypothetical protein